jgi:undecaprenyl-diphosphatase
MSDVLEAAVLGVVQGLTEFLPVSSTGHLIVAEKAMGLSQDEFGLRFDAAIHLGTLAAVLVYFRTTVLSLAVDWLQSIRSRDWNATPQSRLAWLLLIGTIPAAIAGAAFENTIDEHLRSAAVVATMLILFSLPMVLAELYGSRRRDVPDATPRDALILGVAQSIALVPGVSRSGITISAAMFDGFRREEAAVFTFLLSAPIIAAAGGKQLFDVIRGSGDKPALSNEYAVYGAGLLTAAIVGYAAIAFLVRYLRFNPLYVFVGYRLLAGLVILALVAGGAL